MLWHLKEHAQQLPHHFHTVLDDDIACPVTLRSTTNASASVAQAAKDVFPSTAAALSRQWMVVPSHITSKDTDVGSSFVPTAAPKQWTEVPCDIAWRDVTTLSSLVIPYFRGICRGS